MNWLDKVYIFSNYDLIISNSIGNILERQEFQYFRFYKKIKDDLEKLTFKTIIFTDQEKNISF